MSAEALFSLCGNLALLGWILLLLSPWLRWAPRYVCGLGIPAIIGVLYTYLIVSHWGESQGGFSSLTAVSQLFANRWLLLAGWVHYLAFDLFVGSWEARDAMQHKIPHLIVIPCLILTFLFGPAGLLLYLLIRTAFTRSRLQPA